MTEEEDEKNARKKWQHKTIVYLRLSIEHKEKSSAEEYVYVLCVCMCV